MKELMVFRIGGRPFGLDLDWIKGVYRAADLEDSIIREGNAAPSYRLEGGEASLRDLSKELGSDDQAPAGGFRKVLLLEVRGRALALGVDQVERVINASALRIVPLPPIFTGKSRTWFPWVVIWEDSLIPLLDPEPVAGVGEADANLTRRIQSLIREQAAAENLLRGLRNGISAAMDREVERMKDRLRGAGSRAKSKEVE